MTAKHLSEVLSAQPTIEGAGVRLHRGFAGREVPRFDPFLLFDDFSSPTPADYLAGFPMHPHRGIETVTYILDGDVRHKDSLGNSGMIGNGDVQWMTAGSGIIHEEMPEGTRGIRGFQLWVNLPSEAKMMTPRYQDVRSAHMPVVSLGAHAKVRVISGKAEDTLGPVQDLVAETLYVDVTLEKEKPFAFPVPEGYTTFIYVFEGTLGEGHDGGITNKAGDIMLFSRTGDEIHVRAGSSGARFLIASGRPLEENIAWHGPIVMNTDDELRTAFRELSEGTFIKSQGEIRSVD